MSLSQPSTGNCGINPRDGRSWQLSESELGSLAVTVGAFVAEALQHRQSVLVIATPTHIAAFTGELRRLGAELDRAVNERQLAFLDAEQTLSEFMVDGCPDERLFRNTIGAAIERLRGSADGAGNRAYAEMAGILSERGQTAGALRLQEHWNNFPASAALQLYSAHPIDTTAQCENSVIELLPSNNGLPGRADLVVEETAKCFRSLVEKSSDATLLMNAQDEVRYASPSTLRVLGCSAKAILGGDCFDLIHPDDRGHLASSFAAARAAPFRPIHVEVRLRPNEDHRGWVELTITDLSGDPAVAGIVWNCRDITERKASEQALRESEHRLAARERYLQALLNSMPECVKVLDRNGEVLEMNAAGLRMVEADSDEQIIGKCAYSVIGESDRAAFQALNESVFEGGEGGTLEFGINGLKGAHRTFETHVVALRDEADRVIGALSATRDITQRNATEAALRQANESLEQFAYAAAHDLQEPIRNVALYTGLLAQRYGGELDERANGFMTTIVEGARRMQALVQDLLTYARSLDKPYGEQPNNTDANDAIAEVLQNLRPAIDNTGAEVVCGNLPRLPLFRPHLVQLLQNLIENALKYRSEQSPRIEVSAVERTDEVVIAVRDNGIGILPEQRGRIFGMFKRLHGRHVPGNGIGLAICQRIISHYGGRIWVEPQQGHGSTFAFTLPGGSRLRESRAREI